jgi:hypothetical protein
VQRRSDRVDNFETVRRRKDGSLIDVLLTISPIESAEGKVVGAVKIAIDITERTRNEAQVVVFAQEAEHRAQNLLANLRAMLRLSQSDTPDGLSKAIEGRIEALANVNSLFVESRWAGAELGRLIEQELSPYSMRARIDGPSTMLNPELAQAMAIVLHELATNAAKYGALSVHPREPITPLGDEHLARRHTSPVSFQFISREAKSKFFIRPFKVWEKSSLVVM